MEENKIVIYQTEDGQTLIDVRLENDTVWLTQAQMADLFQKDRTVITRHINNVFKEGELERELVSAKFAHTTRHGANLSVSSYVEQEDTREVINITEVNTKLESLVAEGNALNTKIAEIIKELGE